MNKTEFIGLKQYLEKITNEAYKEKKESIKKQLNILKKHLAMRYQRVEFVQLELIMF